MKSLTIFTPAYNRAYCLHLCYESLIRQSNQDFIWLIIDDGSTDNTKALVTKWISDCEIEIKYHYQENQGMHGAHNTAYTLIKTELNVCIDSDDFMPDTAIEHILTHWSKINNKENLSGIIGLDAFKNGQIIGQKMPSDLEHTTLEDLHHKYGVTGDKKLVLRTEIVKNFPAYPIFPEERFVPLGTLYLLLDKKYKVHCLNKVLCIVEYMEDGSSRNIIKQYRRHPRGFQYARLIAIKHSKYFKVRFKSAVHLISHCIQLKDFKTLTKTSKSGIIIISIPFGVLLYLYILYINKVKL